MPATISGSGIHRRLGRTRREARRLDLLAQRAQLAADRFRPFDQRVDGGSVAGAGGAGHGGEARRVHRLGEEPGERRLRSCAIAGGRGAVGVEVEHFALGAQPIEAGGIAGRFALGEDLGQVAEAIARGAQLALADLRGGKLREGERAGRPAPAAPVRPRG